MKWWPMKRSCVYPELMHRGHPVHASNFQILDNGMVVLKCPETGRWFEAFLACTRYKCCKSIIWIEKDYVNVMGQVVTLDLTSDEPTF